MAYLVLVSLGIVDKKMFVLRRGHNPQWDNIASQSLESERSQALSTSLQQWGRRTEKQSQEFFFFKRYKTRNVKPTAETDRLIRNFVTTVIREDLDVLMTAMQFKKRYLDLIKDLANREPRADDKQVMITEFLQEILEDQNFMDALKERVRNKYMPALVDLLS